MCLDAWHQSWVRWSVWGALGCSPCCAHSSIPPPSRRGSRNRGTQPGAVSRILAFSAPVSPVPGCPLPRASPSGPASPGAPLESAETQQGWRGHPQNLCSPKQRHRPWQCAKYLFILQKGRGRCRSRGLLPMPPSQGKTPPGGGWLAAKRGVGAQGGGLRCRGHC